LDDIVKVVEASATCNVAQLVGDQQGNVLVKTYNWLDFFDAHFRRLKDIKKYHQFFVSNDHPGVVFAREYTDSPPVHFDLLKDNWQPSATELPPVIQPSGLSSERQ
jgi:hypothetical protein